MITMSNEKVPRCACGCGQAVNKGRRGTWNRFIVGHNTKRNTNSKPASTGRNSGQFKSGQSGNPAGRRNGSKNAVTVASGNLIEGEGEALTRKLIELALDGNVSCLRHAIDRLYPVKRSTPIKLEGMPIVNDIESAAEASAFLLSKVSAGEVSPQDAEMVSRLIDKYIGATKWVDIEQELQRLTERLEGWNYIRRGWVYLRPCLDQRYLVKKLY